MVAARDIVKLRGMVKLIESETEHLGRYLEGLSPKALAAPSFCNLWAVQDVVGHLVFIVEFCLDVISRGQQGDTAPPEGFPPAGDASREWSDEHFAQSAIARRKSLGQQLVPTFAERYEQLYRLMSDLSPQDWQKPCYHEGGVRPAQRFIMTALNELNIHGWDIRSSLEPSPHLSPEVLPVLMERIRQRYQRPRAPDFLRGYKLTSGMRYRFELTGAVTSQEDIIIENDECRIESAAGATADVVFRCDSETFILLMNRRLGLDQISVTQ